MRKEVMTIKQLQAKNGKSISFKLDSESFCRLKHAKEFIERGLEMKVSNAVIVRRALEVFTEYLDEAIKDIREGNPEVNFREQWFLKGSAEGGLIDELEDIHPMEQFPTYEERRQKYLEENPDLSRFFPGMGL